MSLKWNVLGTYLSDISNTQTVISLKTYGQNKFLDKKDKYEIMTKSQIG